MIDIHAHLLPAIDDGSQSVEESAAMLALYRKEPVTAIVATPHFYAEQTTVTAFLEARERALETLTAAGVFIEGTPPVYTGAEVLFYPGISREPELRRLTLAGSRYLLLEMPMTSWPAFWVREVQMLPHTSGVVPVLAHIERYLSFPGNERQLRQLLAGGCQAQINTSWFRERSGQRAALRWLRSDAVWYLGTDAHNVTTRPPCMRQALEVIAGVRGGEQLVNRLEENGQRLLEPATPVAPFLTIQP